GGGGSGELSEQVQRAPADREPGLLRSQIRFELSSSPRRRIYDLPRTRCLPPASADGAIGTGRCSHTAARAAPRTSSGYRYARTLPVPDHRLGQLLLRGRQPGARHRGLEDVEDVLELGGVRGARREADRGEEEHRRVRIVELVLI